MKVFAEIRGLRYTPFLCKNLNTYPISKLDKALSESASFVVKLDEESKVAMSWWVSPKRTRSYPYARVYDTLGFVGRHTTVIPVLKDEGLDGDRDFLQWDTVSLMSLLGVYVIISHYVDAEKNPRYTDKITKQRLDVEHIKGELLRLVHYQSDALHWNLSQTDKVGEMAEEALHAYDEISARLSVRMHSRESAFKRIGELQHGRKSFMELSRRLAKGAQRRESLTEQPKEKLAGKKGTITIKNFLGGYYYFTCDEVAVRGREVYLIEGKHTKEAHLPSVGDIKDGLIKMALFSSLQDVMIDGHKYAPVPVLKLTTGEGLSLSSLRKGDRMVLEKLMREAEENGFRVRLNDEFLV